MMITQNQPGDSWEDPTTNGKQINRVLSEELIKTVLILFALQVVFILSHYFIGAFLDFSWRDWLFSIGTMLAIMVIAAASAAYIGRTRLIDQLNAKLKLQVENLELSHADKLRELEKVLEASVQLKELMKEGQSWLVDDQLVFQIESDLENEEILVLVPDFHYEFQEKYFEVIATNIKRDDGPTYRYFVHKDYTNDENCRELHKRLKKELVDIGKDKPDEILSSRFKVTFLEENTFPEFVLYGLVIFRKRDRTLRCLQYLPREIGALNINIPVDGVFGGPLVKKNREYLNRLADGAALSAAVGQTATTPR
jgi:hypothetical protein